MKIILKELLGLTNLSKAQIFYIHEIIKVVIIYEDKNFMFATF